VAVVTNQSGIGRGYYSWDDLCAVLERMQALLAEGGAHVDAVFACPHHPDARPPFAHADHPGRKPNPGMLERAATALQIDLACSWLVGDTLSDAQAGLAAGLAGTVHVLTGLGREERSAVRRLRESGQPVRLAEGIGDLLDLLPLLGDRP
jgi:D-glycero-D-manno-heptose 1,7-bisphosphate phosphatase